MTKKSFLILIIIFLAGLVLRFYRLGDVPVGFHRDEAFLGYNAYSLLKTGRDMSGVLFPIHFESFIHSPGGYSYLAIPAVFLFGLNEFSVRFPSAFFGSLSIFLVFYLIRKLFSKISNVTSLAAALLLAVTPWHINLSRTSTESTVVVFFLSLGVYLFLHWKQTQKYIFLLLSFISFTLTLTLYQAPRAFLPLFIPLLIVTIVNTKFKKRIAFTTIHYLLFIILPVVFILSTPTLATRMSTVGIWSTDETKLVIEEQIREDGVKGIPAILSRFTHNKFTGYSEAFLKNYFQHLSYSFLFTDNGLPDRYRVPHAGLLYLSMLPLIIVGLNYLLIYYTKQGLLLTSWILLSIVGSALTFDDIPNLQRTLLVFPALSIIMAFGLERIYYSKQRYVRTGILILIIGIFFLEGYRYIHHYYVQQLVHRPWYRHEGYKELVSTVQKRKESYNNIVVTNRESAPAIFFLFYTGYEPKKFQEETKNSTFRDFDRINFGNYIFVTDECPLNEVTHTDPATLEAKIDCNAKPDTLYINSGLCQIPKICANMLHTVKRSDNTSVFFILERSDAAATLSSSIQKL